MQSIKKGSDNYFDKRDNHYTIIKLKIQESLENSLTCVKRLDYSILFVGCEEGWSLHDSYCYRVFTNTITWENAKSACQTEGAALGSVLDMETNMFVNWQTACFGGYLQT